MKNFGKKHLAIVIGILLAVVAIVVTVSILATRPHYDSEFHTVTKEQAKNIEEKLTFLSDEFVNKNALVMANEVTFMLDRRNVETKNIKSEYINTIFFEYQKGTDKIEFTLSKKPISIDNAETYQQRTVEINGTQTTFYSVELPENEAGIKGQRMALFSKNGYFIQIKGGNSLFDLVEDAVREILR